MVAVWLGIPDLFTFAILKLVIHTCSSETCLCNVPFRYEDSLVAPDIFQSGRHAATNITITR